MDAITRGSRHETAPHRASAARAVPEGWGAFVRMGGVAAILYDLAGIVAPFVLVTAVGFDFSVELTKGGAEVLAFIAGHRSWFLWVQTLTLASSIFAVVAFVALSAALWRANAALAVAGGLVGATCQILFFAYYPMLLGFVYLSDQFAAAGEARRAALGTAAEALIAQNSAFNPAYESVFAASILLLSLAMLRSAFHPALAYLGMATAIAAVVGLSLWGVLGVAYFWWWLLFFAWFALVGWKMTTLGSARPPHQHAGAPGTA